MKESIRSFVNPGITASCAIAQGYLGDHPLRCCDNVIAPSSLLWSRRREQSTIRFKDRLNSLKIHWCIHPISRYSDPWTSPEQLHLITFRISDAPSLGKVGVRDQEGRPPPTNHIHHYTDYPITTYNHETAANEEIFEHYQVIHLP